MVPPLSLELYASDYGNKVMLLELELELGIVYWT